jgi:hypothetical protein
MARAGMASCAGRAASFAVCGGGGRGSAWGLGTARCPGADGCGCGARRSLPQLVGGGDDLSGGACGLSPWGWTTTTLPNTASWVAVVVASWPPRAGRRRRLPGPVPPGLGGGGSSPASPGPVPALPPLCWPAHPPGPGEVGTNGGGSTRGWGCQIRPFAGGFSVPCCFTLMTVL